MSVCVETSTTALVQPVASCMSTNTAFSEVVVSTASVSASTITNDAKIEQQPQQQSPPALAGKSIAKLVVANQQNSNQVLQKVVNSPLITVLNSTGPLTVVKSLCVTSVVSSAPQYTFNTAPPLNVTNAVGKSPTITVLNCGTLASPVTVVKTISTQPIEKSAVVDNNNPTSTVPNNVPVTTSAIIENRGHNVFVKNSCPDSTIQDNIPQSHKLLTATNFSNSNVINNIPPIPKASTANGQRNKLKILSNIQIAGTSQQNVMLNKVANLPQPRYNVTARQKFVGVTNPAPIKYFQKSQNNVLKSNVNPTVKSPQEKSTKTIHSAIQKCSIKSLPPGTFIPKAQPQSIKTLSPQHTKNVPGQIQRTGTGLRTIPPQRPQKVATKTNYIGKHAIQAQKIKQSTITKLKNVPRQQSSNICSGYHHQQQQQQQQQPSQIHEKQLTFNQALTAQIIETLSNTSAPPPPSRYEILPSRYDSAFNCPDNIISPEPSVKADDNKANSGLDALSLICQAVLLDHNYNATPPSESPPRPTQPINTQAQVNGISSGLFSPLQKRRIVPPTITSLSHFNVSLTGHSGSGPRDDDAASDVSDCSDRKHDTEGEETDTAPEAEDVKNDDHYGDYVTRCICGFLHDDGYMVECDKCKVWQHVQCVVKNRQIPDEYLCELCDPSKPVDRQKARMIQQQWIRERQLIEPKIRKEAKLKDTLRQKDRRSDSDSSDNERVVRNNNITTKSRTAMGRRKSEGTKGKKDIKEPIQRRQKRKEKKIFKRRTKLITKPQQQQQQSQSDDENQDTWSAHLPQLRQWIEKYEEAVTNHYSPELRARISSIRVNGTHVDSTVSYDPTVCKCRIHTQPLTEIKYLVSTVQLTPNTPVIELRGKYMLSTQHRNSGVSLATRQHNQKPGPFLFFYRLQKDNTEVCVDTRTYGNSARFIRRSCKPNAELRHCIEKGVLHLYIVSIATVEKNCELTIKHESHDLAAIGTTHIACACGRPEECSVNKTTIKNNGEVSESVTRKRRGRRTISSNAQQSPNLKSPTREPPPLVTTTNSVSKEILTSPPLPSVSEEINKEAVEEKVDVIEPVEVKIDIKEEPIEEKPTIENCEVKNEPIKIEEECRVPTPPPIKGEVKKEKVVKEEKVKSLITPIGTRRSSHQKIEKEESVKSVETKPATNKSSKKLSREERKLEAILRAIEQMEKADQKKQEHQAKQAHRRESEPGPTQKEEDKPEPTAKVKRRRRRGRARTTSTSAQARRSRLNSTDSYVTSGDENLLSPNEGTATRRKSSDKAADLLLALSNGDSDKDAAKKSVSLDQDSNSNSASSSPETPQLSSACLLVQAAVEPLESGFKFPKTKKGLMNEWLNKAPDLVQPASSISPSSLLPHLVDDVANSAGSSKSLAALAQAATFCDSPSQQQRGGNAKKRWLRQAISEDQSTDSPIGRPDSPTTIEAVAPPKKRKLPRESLSNDNSPPSTPTGTGPPKVSDNNSDILVQMIESLLEAFFK
ncbi:hypothetical protein ABEB36_009932 [Hypothenemus hampei]|uniref:SET domain-containing protein n=1 Tax=Hypothenemus hampei TaxID=57062 RepID=A0ABD1EIL1_HYPHA